ncbi:hypothetical protein FNV43_RR13192 [Rhamnella rubrinervis]|uniref:Uncharacterized protein n=1 Tax=Rhamnella rubrinervis TaxID=2594499 RepID=A0A8K0MDS9_9ROSA|nr:hypothetical protein FNV43_RR13192 [Rhamnella rubrinervis]
MKKAKLVFIPAPGAGHLVSMIEFTKQLLSRDDRFSVTIIVIKSPFELSVNSDTSSSFPPIPISTTFMFPQFLLLHPNSFSSPQRSTIPFILKAIKSSVRKSYSTRSWLSLFHSPGWSLTCSPPAWSTWFMNLGFPTCSSPPVLGSRIRALPSEPTRPRKGVHVVREYRSEDEGDQGYNCQHGFELESHAVSSLSDGETPPVYTVGPLIDHKWVNPFRCDQSQRDKIMKWLDDQPAKTRDLGLLCGWAPQVEVLAHRSIGGFVSHCGWNSTLESLWHGVPLVTWLLSAEQQINAFQMVKDLGLSVELRLDYRRDCGDHHLVVADDIEKAVRSVMDGDGDVEKKVQEMSEKCRRAVVEGGSSFGLTWKLD